MLFGELTTEERLSRMKIQLQDEQPFWAYLILKLRMEEDTKGKLPPYGGMGVNIKGEMLWRKDFVDKLTDDELKFCLAHEVGHLVFAHLMRLGSRDPPAFNVASDIVLNDILQQNGFRGPQGILMPSNHEIVLGDKVIENTHKKTAEEVYDELPKIPMQMSGIGAVGQGSNSQDGNGDSEQQDKGYNYKTFDAHDYGEGASQSEKDAAAEKWKDSTMEAAVMARQGGKLPAGMEELIGDIMNPKFNWKHLLRKFITNTLPFDYSFSRPNRKIPGIILPGVVKETVDIVVHVDTSWSISPKELSEFMSEIIGIGTAHHNLNMTLIECDADIQQVVEVNSKNISKLKSLKIKGRGGTSHKPIWEFISKNKPQCKLFVSLTDLCSDIELSDKPRYEVVWITPNNQWNGKAPFGKTLVLK